MRIGSIFACTGKRSAVTIQLLAPPAPAGLAAAGRTPPPRRLLEAQRGRVCTVRELTRDPAAPERARQLEEIGFCPGEQVTVLARGFPGGDPLVVRIGQSTFALRAAEAACVQLDAGGAEDA